MLAISVTLESTVAVEWPSEDTCVLHNVIKRVWPASQRDALFWSHKRHLHEDSDDKPDRWIVVNYSTSHPKVPVSCINDHHFVLIYFMRTNMKCLLNF